MSPEPCCKAWSEALVEGTDNEGYGPLIYQIDADDVRVMAQYPGRYPVTLGQYRTGSIAELPTIRFCPWCGAPQCGA